MTGLQRAAGRLLNDPGYRRAFFAAAEEDHASLGVDLEEFRVLRRLDVRSLDVVSEGFVGKRFDHVLSVFPGTLEVVRKVLPDVESSYLAQAPRADDEAGERATFVAFLAEVSRDGMPDAVGLRVRDLARVELALYEHPVPTGLPAFRLRPGTLLGRGPAGVVVDLEASGRSLAVRDAGRLVVEPLVGEAAAVLGACDGRTSLEALVARLGAPVEARVRTWLRLRILEEIV